MPDQFGQETPQEALQRVRASFQTQNKDFWDSNAAASPGMQAGQALTNLFGGVSKKFLETRADRKSETQRLVEQTGLDKETARAIAKQNIPLAHREVRMANRRRQIAKQGNATTEALRSSGENEIYARAVGMIQTAQQLRLNGFESEATQMTNEAIAMRQAEEQRLAEVENLKARTNASRASTRSSHASADQAGETSFTKLVNRSEELQAAIDTADSPETIAMLERMQGRIDGQIMKLNTVTGTTEHDPLSTAGKNKQATEIIEQKVLLDGLNMLDSTLEGAKGDMAATLWGNLGNRALGAMESMFNRTPTETEQEFQQRVAEINGGIALIAAGIRHSLTGAAMSPAEAVFLEPFLPLPSDSRTQMQAKVKVLIRYTQQDIETRQYLLNNKDEANAYMANLARQERAEAKKKDDAPLDTEVEANEAIDDETRKRRETRAEANRILNNRQ